MSTAERTRAAQTMLELQSKYNGRITATAGPLYEGLRWNWMKQKQESTDKITVHGGTLSACRGVFSQIAVRADGIMVPCIHLSHIELGRINQDSLADVWQTHPELRRLRERCNIPLESFEYCRGCEYIFSCSGGCPALAYNLIGNDEHPSPDSCLRKFIEDGGKLPHYAEEVSAEHLQE